jgi:hypothetical protein
MPIPALLIAGLSASCLAADRAIDDFSAGVAAWRPTMQYGDVSRCRISAGQGVEGTRGMWVECDMRGPETNHVIFWRDVELDLSCARGLSFQVRGDGDPVSLFLFVYDSKGRFCNYGPHGTNPDFTSGYADWKRLSMSFEDDRSVQRGDADLADVRKIGLMFWHMGPADGTAWIDDLAVVQPDGYVTVRPAQISPNGDGVNDTATIVVRAPPDHTVTISVMNIAGRRVTTLAKAAAAGPGGVRRMFDGSFAPDRKLPAGTFIVDAVSEGPRATRSIRAVTIDGRPPWPPVKYELEPFFPVGVWFEGAPSINGAPGDPEGARKYYDQCFADMAAHGFNAAAVPNCPESLWEPLLQSAQEHGVKIALEVGPLVGLVGQDIPPTESQVEQAVRQVYERIGRHDSLLRYQIRDEPPRDMVDNWLLVRRILAAVDPKHPAFSCFCHPDSLAAVAAQAKLTEAVVDIYPHMAATPPQSLGGFLPALDRFRTAMQDNRWWAVLQAFGVPPPSWRYPSAEELRAVTYLSLAAGAKGVFYFIYQYMPDYLWGMVALDGTPQPIYAPASQLAQELQKLSPLLLSLKPSNPPPTVEGEARVGSFLDPDGRAVLIVASTRPDTDVTAAITVEGGAPWRDALTGESLPPADNTLTVSLAPGAGRVLVHE